MWKACLNSRERSALTGKRQVIRDLENQLLRRMLSANADGVEKKRIQVSDFHARSRATHIHVFKVGKQVIINLGDEEHRVSTRENKGMATADVVKALQIAAAHQAFLLEQWREIHG